MNIDTELSAYDEGARDALRSLADAFENVGETFAAETTRKALAIVEEGARRSRLPDAVGYCGSCNCVCPCVCGCPSCGCVPSDDDR